jgi:N-dimethylarginine dimethylaminohydrolase
MTVVAPSAVETGRTSRPRRFAMCPPRYFAVSYSINPWMQPARPVDQARAQAQWETLRATYVRLGHEVVDIPPVAGLPDLVFAANAGIVIDGRALASRFRHAERSGEEQVFIDWFRAQGLTTAQAGPCNEGEGDYLVTDAGILAGSGFRSDTHAWREVATFFDRPVIPLELVDPRFYHLDTALAVLDGTTVAYWPGAFSAASGAALRHFFPDAILATEADAVAFGLNACSDGRHVVLAAGATGLIAELAARGFVPVPVELSELQKAGGAAKCCTLELRGPTL